MRLSLSSIATADRSFRFRLPSNPRRPKATLWTLPETDPTEAHDCFDFQQELADHPIHHGDDSDQIFGRAR